MPKEPPPPRIMYVLLIVFAASFDDRPVVVASVTGLGKQLDPGRGIVVVERGQDPALEQRFLLGRAVAVDLHIRAPAAQPLYLLERNADLLARQVVQRVDRQHAIKARVG